MTDPSLNPSLRDLLNGISTDVQLLASQTLTLARAEVSTDEVRKLIAEAAYYRAKKRGFTPGHEVEDWVQAEAEVLRRIRGADHSSH